MEQRMKRDWIDLATLVILTLTLCFVVIYTVITGYMASIANSTANRQLRAYVSVVSGSMMVVQLKDGGLGITVHVELKNSGQTPGYKFLTWMKPPLILDSEA